MSWIYKLWDSISIHSYFYQLQSFILNTDTRVTPNLGEHYNIQDSKALCGGTKMVVKK